MSKSKVYTACTARWPFTDLSLYTDWLIQKTDGHAYLFVLPVDEGEFELELCGVDGEDPGSDLPIQTENAVPLDPGDVDGQVQGTDDAVVTEGETDMNISQHSVSLPQVYARYACF